MLEREQHGFIFEVIHEANGLASERGEQFLNLCPRSIASARARIGDLFHPLTFASKSRQ